MWKRSEYSGGIDFRVVDKYVYSDRIADYYLTDDVKVFPATYKYPCGTELLVYKKEDIAKLFELQSAAEPAPAEEYVPEEPEEELIDGYTQAAWDACHEKANEILNEWLLETRVDGAWHSMRLKPDTSEKNLKWEFPAEEYGPNSGPSGIVNWNGVEQRYLCNVARYYRTPLEPGLYRIVFPDMEHRNVAALAVEFYIEELE